MGLRKGHNLTCKEISYGAHQGISILLKTQCQKSQCPPNILKMVFYLPTTSQRPTLPARVRSSHPKSQAAPLPGSDCLQSPFALDDLEQSLCSSLYTLYVEPQSWPPSQVHGECWKLTPVITAQSDTVARRSMMKTCTATLMITWGEDKHCLLWCRARPPAPPCTRQAEKAERSYPISFGFISSDPGLPLTASSLSSSQHQHYSDELRGEDET